MKEKAVNAMQKFAKAMIGPVLYLPIVGMLIALTAVATNTAFVTEGGVIWIIGRFFNGMLNPIMSNLSILFCVGIAIGMAKKKKADAAFIALMSYILFLGANSRWLELSGMMVDGATAGDLYGTGQTIQLGFHVTDMGVFLGMILGVVTAAVHNRYSETEFKGGFAPYGNTKLVLLVMIPVGSIQCGNYLYLADCGRRDHGADRLHERCWCRRGICLWIFKQISGAYRAPSSDLVPVFVFRGRRTIYGGRRECNRGKAYFPGIAQ